HWYGLITFAAHQYRRRCATANVSNGRELTQHPKHVLALGYRSPLARLRIGVEKLEAWINAALPLQHQIDDIFRGAAIVDEVARRKEAADGLHAGGRAFHCILGRRVAVRAGHGHHQREQSTGRRASKSEPLAIDSE